MLTQLLGIVKKTIVYEKLGLSCVDAGSNFSDGDTYRLNADPICANICNVISDLESETFLAAENDNMKQSKMAMALGSVTKDDFGCELFEMTESEVAEAIATIIKAQAGSTTGVSSEHLSNIFRISHEEAENIISATSQLNRQDGNISLSRNFTTNDCML